MREKIADNLFGHCSSEGFRRAFAVLLPCLNNAR